MDKSTPTRLTTAKVRSALNVLINKKYHYIGEVAKGCLGVVLKLETPDKRIIAAKFVSQEEATEEEIGLWKNFHHPNALPLLDIIETPHKRMFLMPFCRSTLQDLVQSDNFCAVTDNIDIIQKWLTNILKGLQYLHGLGVCHMDIKPNNILSTLEPKAIICDFGFATRTDAPVSRYGMPAYLKPPEACMSLGKDPEFDGKAFDIWTFGQLAFRLFTRKLIYSRTDVENLNVYKWNGILSNVNFWPTLVYPRMYHNLQPEEFEDIIQKAYPAAIGWDRKISQALNLVRCILRFNPVERPNLQQLEDHVLFKEDEGEGEWFQDDPMWDEWRNFGTPVLVDPEVPSEESVKYEPLLRSNSVHSHKVALHVPRRNVLPCYDIALVQSEPVINKVQESYASPHSIHIDGVAAPKEFRLDSRVYWDAHEGVFAVQPREKKKGGIRGWLRKKIRGLRSCCSCLGGQD